MLNAFLFAGIAAIGNAIFVYGQRNAPVSENPFLFIAGASLVCTLLFAAAVLLFNKGAEVIYLQKNYPLILLSGIGFFVTFIGFFLMYRAAGASIYTVYAILSLLTTSIGIGVLVMREPFNLWHLASVGTALLTIILFGVGQLKG